MERFLLTFLLLADLEEFLGGLFHLIKEKPIVNSLCTVTVEWEFRQYLSYT